MTLPLIDHATYQRMSWYARKKLHEARIQAVREAQRAHHARYHGAPAATPTPEPEPGMNAQERADEIAWLRAAGTPADEIVRRLHAPSPEALERQMHRHGRDDLAALFAPLRHAKRKTPCPECGRLKDFKAKTCAACFHLVAKKTGACPRPRLLTAYREAKRSQRKVAQDAAKADQRGGDFRAHLIAEANELVASAVRDLEWHDANCDLCGAKAAAA